ncbi:hypothetical protein SteCoe_12868 [Stentor coeruleus]|uniref:Uncharacterized protein n=1 Tax=Stentor coeruleus TaxID=5963 RepID=A0A1R2C9S6_9CILI|nr:hypothetical protein SteCoe_12868 [Stentor coeruleus]
MNVLFGALVIGCGVMQGPYLYFSYASDMINWLIQVIILIFTLTSSLSFLYKPKSYKFYLVMLISSLLLALLFIYQVLFGYSLVFLAYCEIYNLGTVSCNCPDCPNWISAICYMISLCLSLSFVTLCMMNNIDEFLALRKVVKVRENEEDRINLNNLELQYVPTSIHVPRIAKTKRESILRTQEMVIKDMDGAEEREINKYNITEKKANY